MNNNSLNNIPSVINCPHNTRCFTFLPETPTHIIIGTCNGTVHLFNWENEALLLSHSLPFSISESSTTTTQIINILPLSNHTNHLLIQSRGGIIFICSYSLYPHSINVITTINTSIETFCKCIYINNTIFIPHEKENEVKLITLTSLHNNNKHSECVKKVYFTNDVDENASDSDDDDYNNDDTLPKKALICGIVNNNTEYIATAFENGVVALYSADNEMKYYTHCKVYEKKIEAIITIYLFTINNIQYICVGMFSTTIVLLQITNTNNVYNIIKYKSIHNVCSSLKEGISAICYVDCGILQNDILNDDDDDDDTTNTTEQSKFLIVGGYDNRIKFYQISTSTLLNFTDIGNININGNSIINQIQTYHYNNNTYLFICSEQHSFYIYLIA